LGNRYANFRSRHKRPTRVAVQISDDSDLADPKIGNFGVLTEDADKNRFSRMTDATLLFSFLN
jgi:hypothetical protein